MWLFVGALLTCDLLKDCPLEWLVVVVEWLDMFEIRLMVGLIHGLIRSADDDTLAGIMRK